MKEYHMRGVALALLALAAGIVVAAGSTPAEARNYRYCLQSPEEGIPGDCSYETYRQCSASASGRRAYCNLNPWYAFNGPERPRTRRPVYQGY
jgi:hypothetical protein